MLSNKQGIESNMLKKCDISEYMKTIGFRIKTAEPFMFDSATKEAKWWIWEKVCNVSFGRRGTKQVHPKETTK